MKEFLIRRADIEDLKDILCLNFELFKKEYREFDKSLDFRWTYTKGKKYFRNRLLKKDGFVEIVEYKGKAVGYLCGGLTKELPYRRKVKCAELENTFIVKRFRGKGLGRKMARNFLSWCKKNKAKKVIVSASFFNKYAVIFYKKTGFKERDLILSMEINKNI